MWVCSGIISGHIINNTSIERQVMKNALILGGGSKFGAELTKQLSKDYHIDLITSSDFTHDNVTTHTVDWMSLDEDILINICNKISDKKFDIIFFNQNSFNKGGPPNAGDFAPGYRCSMDEWHNHYWINCMSTYFITQTLSNCITENTKVGWMISGIIHGDQTILWQHGGYAAVKNSNVHLMRGFASEHPGIFFAINPGHMTGDIYKQDAEIMIEQIENLTSENNGELIENYA